MNVNETSPESVEETVSAENAKKYKGIKSDILRFIFSLWPMNQMRLLM